MKNALRFISRNPGLTARRTLQKISSLFYPAFFAFRNIEYSEPRSFTNSYLNTSVCRAASAISYMVMTMLSAAGLIFCREKKVRHFTFLLLIYHLGMNGFFFAVSRYRLAFVPMLIIFMAWAIHHRSDIWAEKRSWKGALTLFIWVLMLADWVPDLSRII